MRHGPRPVRRNSNYHGRRQKPQNKESLPTLPLPTKQGGKNSRNKKSLPTIKYSTDGIQYWVHEGSWEDLGNGVFENEWGKFRVEPVKTYIVEDINDPKKRQYFSSLDDIPEEYDFGVDLDSVEWEEQPESAQKIAYADMDPPGSEYYH